MEPTQRERLAAERRNHNRRIEQLKSEFATHRAMNDEFIQHQNRVAAILGDDEQPCIGTAGGPTA
jgi:hypothetical protein